MSDDLVDWPSSAARLADEITARGALRDRRWHAAVAATRRHVLVPRYFVQDRRGDWQHLSSDDRATREAWAAGVYSNTALVTALHRSEPVSSSSQPSLMVRMLESLALQDGDRVLEIGTGAGYNAALLAHRLTDKQVYSVDVDAELVEPTRERLGLLGLRPALDVRDGAQGWATHAPYDRIVATCSVRSVPWAWAEQLVHGGRALVDVKVGAGAGNLVLLHRKPDRLEGRFLPRWAGFMAMRGQQVTTPKSRGTNHQEDPRSPWVENGLGAPLDPLVEFIAALVLPGHHLSHTLVLAPDRQACVADRYSCLDGSWVTVDRTGEPGRPRVRWGGPTPLSLVLRAAQRAWEQVGRPGWDRFGVTVTADRQQVWLDGPDSSRRWPLER